MKRMMSLLLCMTLIIGLIPGVLAAESEQYLAMGDSITAGTALNEGEPAFPVILAGNNGWELTNLGRDGQTAASLLAQIEDGSCDEAIKSAKVITITTGGNDVMGVLYELVTEAYNADYDPDITAEEVVPIMSDTSDSRWLKLLMVGITILKGDAQNGVPAFADREEFQDRIDECTVNLKEIMACIRKLNNDAAVIVTTQYNPYKNFSGLYEIVGTSVNAGAAKLNAAIEATAEECGYLVADVFTVFQNSSEKLCNATTSPMNLDFHPNARGHEVIAEVIQEIIEQLPDTGEVPFDDVRAEDFFYEPVMWAVENGITTGATETTFDPSGKCLRASVVTFLWRAAGNPEPTTEENPFLDVQESDFFYKAVLWAVENGITNGTTSDTFSPYAECNRAAVVTFLYRAKGEPEVAATEHSFVDVVESQFYYDAMLWAVENGITNGLDTTHFGPTDICNRAQVVTFLYRAE